MAGSRRPRVSVLIPVYNGAAFVGGAISSVLSQSIQDVEVIVIDDASQDDTVAVVSQALANEPRIQLISSDQNSGPGMARSKGLAVARGEWVAVLDADDGMQEMRLEKLIEMAESNNLDAIADNLALIDPGLGDTVGHAFPLAKGDVVEVTVERFLNNVRPGGRVNLGWMQPVVRREFLLQHRIDWPALRHAEDMVFLMRLLMAGAKIQLIGDPQYRYTQRRGSVSGKASDMSRTKRSISEQHHAIDLIAATQARLPLSDWSKQRLQRMRSEIAATSYALDLRDALASRNLLAAALSGLRLLALPVAFARCVTTRYMTGAKLR